jgi:hypothetical protein
VSVGDVTVTEGAPGAGATATLTLTLSRASTTVTSIGWSTVNGTALAGSDFVGASGLATFAAGALTTQITIAVIGDSTPEAGELFSVALSGPTGLTIGDDAGQVTVVNDDAPTVSIEGAVSVTEGNSGSKTVTLTVTLSSATTSTVTVTYGTANGTATSGSDYTAKTGTLTFAPGTTSQTISITVSGDRTVESSETFRVNLTGATNATVAPVAGTATVTIVNDDGSPLAAAGEAPAATAGRAAELTQPELEATVELAKAAWLAVEPTADFGDLVVSVGDLEGALLGITADTTVTIDLDAAGWGWSVAGGAVDLRIVLLHELGHVLGLAHADEGVMAGTLAVGEVSGLRKVAPAAVARIVVPGRSPGHVVEPIRLTGGGVIASAPARTISPTRAGARKTIVAKNTTPKRGRSLFQPRLT